MRTKTLRWLEWMLGVLLLLVLAVYFFNWNWLRGYVERRVNAATGRTLHIRGDLDVKLRRHTLITVNDVTFSNAEWSQQPLMASWQRAELRVDIFSLFHQQIDLPSLSVQRLRLWLEKNPMDVGNWRFDHQPPTTNNSSRSARIGQLTLDDGVISYRSPIEKADIVIAASTAVQSNQQAQLRVAVHGTYHELATDLRGEVGMITHLDDLKESYPLNLSGNIGATNVRANGSIAQPTLLQGIHLSFDLSGASLADLYPLLNIPLPPSPPYSVSGTLVQTGAIWSLNPFKGKIGESDVHGEFAVDRGRQPQLLTANLQSDSLNLKDLSGFIGSRADSGKTVTHAEKVLPDLPLNLDKLHAADAMVKFRAKRIQTTRLPIEDMQANLQLHEGKLVLKPLTFGVGQGTIDALIELDSNASPINAQADVSVRGLRLEQLFPGFDFEKASAGAISGRAKLSGRGSTVANMLGSADGQMAFLMNGGSISKLVVRLANLDVANSVVVLLGGDRSVPIRCMITDLSADDGKLSVNTMVLDTQKSLIDGHGVINLADESLDLTLRSHAKDISLVALRGPIEVTGTFKHPKARVALKQVAGRATIAAALGSLLGPLAFIPLLELGGAKDSDCQNMLTDIQTRFGVKAPTVRSMSYPVTPLQQFSSESF